MQDPSNYLSLAEVQFFGSVADSGNDGPVGYAWCAKENGFYTFNQIVDVAYGANGKYYYKSGMTGKINFDIATFGDPIPGVVKSGYYKLE